MVIFARPETPGNVIGSIQLRTSSWSPPLWGFNRVDQATPEKREQREILFYDTGPVLLHDLLERIGKDGFIHLCQERRSAQIHTTSNFLELLEAQHGVLIREWFQEKLRRGAVGDRQLGDGFGG